MEITVAQLDTDYEVLPDSITVVVSSDYTGPPGSSAGSAGHTIQDEGTNRTARTNLNFVGGGVTVTDDSGNDATVVTIPTGGVTDHGALTGLSDDDHTQYHTDARGDARYQPLDSDLTAIAALSTTSFGRAFLALADAAAGRTALGLGTAATSASSAFDAAGAAAAAQAASQPLDSDLTAIAALTTTSYGRGLLTAANSTALGLVKGDVGLGNVDNTSDVNKPVSTAQQTALDLKANLASPTFTGTVTLPSSWGTARIADADQAANLTALGLGDVAQVTRLLSGMTVPPNSLDRWKAGPGLPGTPIVGALGGTSGDTTVVVKDSSICPDTVNRTYIIDDEEVYVTGGHTTTTLTVVRGVNGTTITTHADGAAMLASRLVRVAHLGDSIAEGTGGSTTVAGDGWSVRAARVLARRNGGLIGEMWGMWRNTSVTQAHQEFALVGSSLAGNAYTDVGYPGGVVFSAGSSNGWTWTRPAGVTVSAFDVHWVDWGSTAADWSYSVDGGTTWTNSGATTIYSSGVGILRRTRVIADNPTTIKVRAANAAGTSKTIVMSYVPLTTWSSVPRMGVTEGVMWANLGIAGVKLRTTLNSRSVFDGTVTNGSTTIGSATMAFTASAVGSKIYIQGVAYTIASQTGTAAVLTSAYAGTTGSSKRFTLFDNDGTGDRLATILGHRGSSFPNLVIVGTFVNDISLPTVAWGDGDPDAYGDMLQYVYDRVSPIADVLYIAPYETTASSSLQASYRDKIEAIAAANNAACLNLYKAFVAYGYTGNAAIQSAGFLYSDGVHPSAKGGRWLGSHLARVLEIV